MNLGRISLERKRPVLVTIIAGDPSAVLCSGRRARLVGNELGALLAGHLSLHVEEGRIVVKPTAGA